MPQISIVSPRDGAEVSGEVEVLVSAYDPEDGALKKIEYYIDGVLKYTDNAPLPMTPTSRWRWGTSSYANGSHTIKVKGYDSQNAAAEQQIRVTVNNGSYGNVNLIVKNVDGSSAVSARVDRHDNSSWVYFDTRTSESNGVASWVGIPAGTYMFRVWKNDEYWGYKPDVSVTAGNTTSATFTRYMPYGESVVSDKATLNSGEQATVTVTVRNNASFSNSVKVELILDRSQSAPYDYDQTSSVQTIAGGSLGEFTFTFTPSQSGTYYRALKVYTNVSGNYTLTDSWAFGALEIRPWISVTVLTSETCGYLPISYRLSDQIESVEVYIDDQEELFLDLANTRECARKDISLSTLREGEHSVYFKGFISGREVARTQTFRFNNLGAYSKIFLVGEGKTWEYPFPSEDPILDFYNVENYKIVIRRPVPRAPYFT
ncbi:MAG: Ig-like domain-containing protein, partial [Anaerolineales bacterium]